MWEREIVAAEITASDVIMTRSDVVVQSGLENLGE